MRFAQTIRDEEREPLALFGAIGPLDASVESVRLAYDPSRIRPCDCGRTFPAAPGGSSGKYSSWIGYCNVAGIHQIIYQPNASASVILDELLFSNGRNARMSELRRKIGEFAQLGPNWDNEGAEPVSAESAETALRVVEHMAVVLERRSTNALPTVRPFPDGSIFFKWICGQKELAITVSGRNIEVQRWEPLDAFQSQGLWEIPVDATAEHVEWVLA